MQQRQSLKATCPDYNEAKRSIRAACTDNAFVWLEALPLDANAKVWPSRPEGVTYAVHAGSNPKDVPAFAIEVYEHGALLRYETERQKIIDFAKMNEDDRIALVRAQGAFAAVQHIASDRKMAPSF